MFDILILAAKKDFNKVEFIIKSIQKNIQGYNNIVCITSIPMPDRFRTEGVHYFHDDEVTDFNYSTINMESRRGWYRQQFIKLFQGVTADNYLVVDSDAYINKPLEIDTTKPVFWLGKDQLHEPYFQFMKDVCGLERCYNYSFINEIMFFKKGVIQHLLDELKMDRYDFFEESVKEINKLNNASGFSEYELYGNYVTKNWPDWYGYRHLKVYREKRYREWTDDEIRQCIHTYSRSNYDLFTMHSWI